MNNNHCELIEIKKFYNIQISKNKILNNIKFKIDKNMNINNNIIKFKNNFFFYIDRNYLKKNSKK